ncbi:MAG: fatty acid desaturase [Myxococcota bacterium]|nr:fatty acid desaturase [Myxococcota bacterium]
MTTSMPISKTLLRAPDVSWPTLGLITGCVIAWGGSLMAGITGVIPLWACCIISGVAAYLAFTPMHDAAHRSVCRPRWVNEVVGRISGFLMMAPFLAFRQVHLTHHQHTNEPDAMVDPDYWSGMGKGPTRLFFWMTQDLFYYVYVLRIGNKIPMAARAEIWLTVGIYVVAGIILTMMGHGEMVLYCWVLPARAAITFLAFAFNFLPHYPYEATRAEDRMRATRIIPGPVLTPIFVCQNYHLIHHLYPGVPFYRYSKVWHEHREMFLSQGAKERSLTFVSPRTNDGVAHTGVAPSS